MTVTRAWLALLVLAVACGDDDAGGMGYDGGAFSDGGRADAPGADAGASDGGEGAPDPLHPSAGPMASPPGRYEDPNDAFNAGSCYDGRDNDVEEDGAGEDGEDCDDVDCASLSSCCVGRPQGASCCQSIREGDVLASLGGCTPGGTPLDCVVGATAFGAPTPFVDDGLAFGGDGVFDSGLIFDDAIDLRTSTLDTSVRFRQADCTGSCRESAAFGVTTQAALGTQSHVDPHVALVVSGERREARLLIADDVAQVWPDVDDGEWRIVLQPNGDVLVGRDEATPQRVGTYTPVSDARVVAWGHSRNPGATDDPGIRIEKLDPQVLLCDMPRAWAARSRIVMQVTDEVDTIGARSPSVVLDGSDVPHMAYVQNDEIHLATRENPSRPERWARNASPVRSDPATAFSAPELVRDATGFRLYYFQRSETRTWFVAQGETLDNLDAGRPLSEPTFDFDQPSIVPIAPPDRPERFAMAAKTGSGIETFASEDGDTWTLHARVPTELLDAAELGAPSLEVVNAGYQLSVAVRRGARWSIATFASAELVHWRLVDDRALQAGDGTERVGVRDLELFRNGGILEAVYVGDDGVRETLHHAQRAIPVLF